MANFLILFTYVVSGKLALMLASQSGYAAPIFPPAGIALAAYLISGRKTLPWIFLGALILNLWAGISAHPQMSPQLVFAALSIAFASVLQAAVG